MTTYSVFDDARRLVSARDAAEYYGFYPNRSGFVTCPFHNEKTASLKLYDDGGWYCFGCHQHGTAIDFTMKLFDLSPLDAVRKLNQDFNLALPLDRPPNEAQKKAIQYKQKMRETEQGYDGWIDSLLDKLNAAYRIGYTALQNLTDMDQLSEAEVLAIRWLEALDDWSECLLSNKMKRQIVVFRDRKEITQLCEKILNCTPMKSSVA